MADDLSPILEIYPKSKLLHLCFIRGIRENSCQITCSRNQDIEIHKFWTAFDRKTRPWLIGGLTLSARDLLAVCLLLLQLLQLVQLVLIKSYLVHPPPTYHGAQTKPIKPGTLRYLVFQPCPRSRFYPTLGVCDDHHWEEVLSSFCADLCRGTFTQITYVTYSKNIIWLGVW